MVHLADFWLSAKITIKDVLLRKVCLLFLQLVQTRVTATSEAVTKQVCRLNNF